MTTDVAPNFQSFTASYPWNPDDKVLYGLRSLMAVLDAIVLPLTGSKADYDNAVLNFTAILTERFATDIQPLFDAITSGAQLGAIFMTSSTTSAKAGLGLKSFDLPQGDRLKYAAPAYIAVVSKANPQVAMLGALSNFDRDYGILTIDVQSVSGLDQTADDWMIVATPPPYVPVGFNAGRYDDSPATAGVPYVSTGTSGTLGVAGIAGGTY